MGQSLEVSSRQDARPLSKDRAAAWTLVAFLIFLFLALVNLRDVWHAGPASHALVSGEGGGLAIARGDVTFEAWLVARHARVLLRDPTALFDTEHCAPAEKTLTLGVPMITMGLLAIPAALVTPNPALAYNFATLVLWLISAMAMYLLVKDWTGSAAAGIVAGIFYALGPWRVMSTVEHPSVYDSAWTIFALYFAQRFFAHGRWRDALGLALSCFLQIAASFYMLVSAVFFSPAFALWLVFRDRFERVRPAQILFLLVSVSLSAFLVLGPYLEARDSGFIGDRQLFYYLPAQAFFAGGLFFLGWSALILAAVGLSVPRKSAVPEIEGDPRWALGIGALLVAVIAAGPMNNSLLELIWEQPPIRIPNFYLLLAEVVPGLDSIRVVVRLGVAMLITLCILAGIGAAWLIRIFPTRFPLVGCTLIGIAILTVLSGGSSREVSVVKVAADPAEVSFFDSLEQMGNEGPVLELPFASGLSRSTDAPPRILLSAYHERRISTCFGSYRKPHRKELKRLVAKLPSRGAVRGLRELGFTTVVVRQMRSRANAILKRKLKRSRDSKMPLLLEQGDLSAYALEP